MKRSYVLRIEREPLTGNIQVRCEESLELFYGAAGAISGLSASDIARNALRQQAKAMARRNPKLKRFAEQLTDATI